MKKPLVILVIVLVSVFGISKEITQSVADEGSPQIKNVLSYSFGEFDRDTDFQYNFEQFINRTDT